MLHYYLVKTMQAERERQIRHDLLVNEFQQAKARVTTRAAVASAFKSLIRLRVRMARGGQPRQPIMEGNRNV
jgi:hypothetical protein